MCIEIGNFSLQNHCAICLQRIADKMFLTVISDSSLKVSLIKKRCSCIW